MPLFLRALVLSVAFAGSAVGSLALHLEQTQSASGLTVYVGVLPPEIVSGELTPAPNAQSQQASPMPVRRRHLTVTVFSEATGNQITDATVAARVSGLSLSGPKKILRRMNIARSATYGDSFDLPGDGPYRIDIDVEHRGHDAVKFQFIYPH